MGIERSFMFVLILGMLVLVGSFFAGDWFVIVFIVGLEFVSFAIFETYMYKLYVKKYGIMPKAFSFKKEEPQILSLGGYSEIEPDIKPINKTYSAADAKFKKPPAEERQKFASLAEYKNLSDVGTDAIKKKLILISRIYFPK